MPVESPCRLVHEFTVVLPQRHRARLVGLAPWDAATVALLVQDLHVGDDGELAPIWRVFRYDLPNTVAVEVCNFNGPEGMPLEAAHLARAPTQLVLLLQGALLGVDPLGPAVDELCQIRLPSTADGSAEVTGMAATAEQVALGLSLGDDRLSLHWVPLGDDPVVGTPFPGGRGERLVFGPDGSLYVLDLMDLYRYRGPELLAERDLADDLAGWERSPEELLAVGPDGRVWAGAGRRLLGLPADLSGVPTVRLLPEPADRIHIVPGTGHLLASAVDAVTSTVRVQVVALDG